MLINRLISYKLGLKFSLGDTQRSACFISRHFIGSARYRGGAVILLSGESSYVLPLLGGGAFSLLVMPVPSWQQGLFRLFSYGLWLDGHDPTKACRFLGISC